MPVRLSAPQAIVALFACRSLFAQSPAGEIRIDLRDSSGAAMQAAGKIDNTRTGVHRDFQTDAQGHYALTGLAYGQYRLELSKEGFSTQVVSVDLESTGPVSRTITLTPAGTHTRVDVVSVTPLAGGDLPINSIPRPVQTETSDVIERAAALDLADLLNKRMNGVIRQ